MTQSSEEEVGHSQETKVPLSFRSQLPDGGRARTGVWKYLFESALFNSWVMNEKSVPWSCDQVEFSPSLANLKALIWFFLSTSIYSFTPLGGEKGEG